MGDVGQSPLISRLPLSPVYNSTKGGGGSANSPGASGDRETAVDFDDLVVVRLHWAGFPVVIPQVRSPSVVRRAVAFGSVTYEGRNGIEGVTGRAADDVDEELAVLTDG
ncbi:hypothetical protein [Halosimplex sp. TS25]|uniref:hypothetical protein n=1 Tax=Halosimplex rarum TaxID=3396619 RepID=UPI0039EBEAEA